MEIHHWMEEKLHIVESELLTLQLVGKLNAVYMKFINIVCYEKYLRLLAGKSNITLLNGDVTSVTISPADMETVSVRVLNIPPEVPNERIENVLKGYGKVLSVVNEKWTTKYRYSVDTGIRIVQMQIEKHIPSNIVIATYDAYITYHGQEQQCFHCGSTTHIRSNCPERLFRRQNVNMNGREQLTFSDVIRSTSRMRNLSSSDEENSTNIQETAVLKLRPTTTLEDTKLAQSKTTKLESKPQEETKQIEGAACPIQEDNHEDQMYTDMDIEQQTYITTGSENSETDTIAETEDVSKSDSEHKEEKEMKRLKRKKKHSQRRLQKSSKNEENEILTNPKSNIQCPQSNIQMHKIAEKQTLSEDILQRKDERNEIVNSTVSQISWHDEIMKEQTTQARNKEEETDDNGVHKSQKNTRLRKHPYKSEESKLSFPPLRKKE